MTPHLERAYLLYQQSRFELAEQECRQALATDPEQPMAHAFLGLCMVERKEYQQATAEAQQAVHQAPDLPFAHYALAKIYFERHRLDEADSAIREAIQLDPMDADYYSLLSSIRLNQHRWKEALSAAEEGLAVDAEHVGCTNLRAMALVKLGRKAEAGLTIDAALAKNPEDAVSHANQGWTLLHQRQPKKALEHFRESLRLNPELEWARQGIVEALKARNPIYALMLRYFLWMAALTPRIRWAIVIGGYIGYRFLMNFADENPDWAPWIQPLLIGYIIFALLTWLAVPVFNLLLRLNRFGRMALSREQTIASNWVGGSLLAALASLVYYFITGDVFSELLALVFALLTLPLAGVFYCPHGWPRLVMAAYTALLALIGLLPFVLILMTIPPPWTLDIFFWGAVLSLWVTSFLVNVQVRH